MTKKEKRVLQRIKKWLGKIHDRYDFWIVGDTWEGGTELPTDLEFRNQYSLTPDNTLIKNW